MFFKNSNPSLPHSHAGSWVCSLNHPLTERCLNRKSRYPKGYRDFFYKKLKNRRETGIYSERQFSTALKKTC